MLERVYVDNYRCLVNFDCLFRRNQLILGDNGSGKTTLFDVLGLLRDFSAHGLAVDSRWQGMTRTRWQDNAIQTFELDVSEKKGLFQFHLSVDSSGSPKARPRVLKEEVQFSGKPLFRFAQGEVQLYNDRYEKKENYPFDEHRSALATITDRPENKKLSWFKHWLASLLFIAPDPHQMHPVATTEALAPSQNLNNFADWYRHIRQESDDDRELIEDLREALPGFKSMSLPGIGMGNRLLSIHFSHTDESDTPYNLSELSDGQRVLLVLYTVLHFAFRRNACIFFDEPDNFIALKEIQPWLDRVMERANDEVLNNQVFLISHHPEVLNTLGFGGGLLFDRPSGRQTRARPFSDPLQTGLSPAELVVRGWEND